ncbi:MAG: MliC family protein [bacterium]
MLGICATASIGTSNHELSLTEAELAHYRCDTGDFITAKYHSLLDNSLSLVELTMPDGQVHTLPNLLSGSGASFSDGHQVTWWTKGEKAFVETRNKESEWRISYRYCRRTAKIE